MRKDHGAWPSAVLLSRSSKLRSPFFPLCPFHSVLSLSLAGYFIGCLLSPHFLSSFYPVSCPCFLSSLLLSCLITFPLSIPLLIFFLPLIFYSLLSLFPLLSFLFLSCPYFLHSSLSIPFLVSWFSLLLLSLLSLFCLLSSPLLFSSTLLFLFCPLLFPCLLYSPFVLVSFPLYSLFLSETTLTDGVTTSSAWLAWLRKCLPKSRTSSCPTWGPEGSNQAPCHLLTPPVHHRLSTPSSPDG